VKLRLEPEAANIVSANVTLCPAVTVGMVAGGGPNPATFTVWVNDADELGANEKLPEYSALTACDPTVSADVLKVA
jgi:hypothetical protein